MVKCPFNLTLDCITVNCMAWQSAKESGTKEIYQIAAHCKAFPTVIWQKKV